jgi:CRP-like cAMP-binding protein
MFHRARVVKLQPGACPIVQDSLPSEVFYVTDGTIKLTRVGLGGRETILGVHGSGSILGAEQAVAGTRHVASATAITECTVRAIAVCHYREAIRVDRDLCALRYVAVSKLYINSLEQCGRLGGDSAESRLAAALIDCIPVSDVAGTKTHRVQFPLRSWEIAQMLAVTPWYLSRMLGKLESDSVIRRNKGWIVILDIDKLTTMA